MSETEQNKTEEATPFKLKRAREKGQLARGLDLGFAASLAAFFGFISTQANASAHSIALSMTQTIALIATVTPEQAPHLLSQSLSVGTKPIALLLFAVVIVVLFFEIIQNRGVVFSTQPLKPDFSRLNPAKGFKRIFSMRMLKETFKSVLKLAVYSVLAVILLSYAMHAAPAADALGVVGAIKRHATKLIAAFLLVAAAFAAIDQILVRGEFRKQMRMGRSELTREIKDRDGDPRIKRKRKQLHAEFKKQVKSLKGLSGSDMLIVNPEHYAVALRYEPSLMEAPTLSAKGRNRFALLLKQRAKLENIVIFENPPLARALFKSCDPGQEIQGEYYRPIAELYRDLRRLKGARRRDSHADA